MVSCLLTVPCSFHIFLHACLFTVLVSACDEGSRLASQSRTTYSSTEYQPGRGALLCTLVVCELCRMHISGFGLFIQPSVSIYMYGINGFDLLKSQMKSPVIWWVVAGCGWRFIVTKIE
ncbi:unnamed protein product, partial [Pylaiella littoralis]